MKKITFGSRELNRTLDDTLMNKYPFASETLMELAGLAIAQVSNKILKGVGKSVCVLAGPGNNGGDGLVAARHLRMMKYDVTLIVFSKLEGKNGAYQCQCEMNGAKVKDANYDFGGQPEMELAQANFLTELDKHDLILDAIFGFPLVGEIRAPYRHFLPSLEPVQHKVFSVDIPSGWDANQGNVHQLFEPRYLISLGMPKKFSEGFQGQHYFGGRFVPVKVCEELGIVLPEFQGDSLYVEL